MKNNNSGLAHKKHPATIFRFLQRQTLGSLDSLADVSEVEEQLRNTVRREVKERVFALQRRARIRDSKMAA